MLEDVSAELFIDPDETLLWRSAPKDRLRAIKEPGEGLGPAIGFCAYSFILAAASSAMMLYFNRADDDGTSVITYFYTTIAVVTSLVTIASVALILFNRRPKPVPHTDYMLTSHRLVVAREDGTSISIFPEAILSIESNRLPMGYHVVLHLLAGDGPFAEPIALTRFRLGHAEELEQRLIAWKNSSREMEHYEQTH